MSATLDPRQREAARLAELNRLGAMQPETDRVLQELVDDAREVFGTEFCLVNLVTADAQFFKVWSGEMPPEISAVQQSPRERSMCRHVVEDEQAFVVEDFFTTERFKEQHLRMGPGVRFYAGTPLETSEGHAVGSLCLVDSHPRGFDDRDKATLRAFARAVVGRLEALGAAAHERAAKESERQYRQNVFELANDAILIYSTETGLVLDANRRACEMYGIPQETLVGTDIAELSLEREVDTVLVLTASSDRGAYARAVEAGAAGVLHKTVRLGEVVGAARGLLAGEPLFSAGEVVELLRLADHARTRDREAQRHVERLTPREMEVLRALADGLSDREVSESLRVGVGTVRNHLVSIFGKLGVNSRLQALVFALRHGIVEID